METEKKISISRVGGALQRGLSGRRVLVLPVRTAHPLLDHHARPQR